MSDPLFKLTIASHFFKLNAITPRVKPLIYEFSKQFIRYQTIKNDRGRFINNPVAVFAAATRDREEFRFHINVLKDFKEFMERRFIPESLYTILTKPPYEAAILDLKIPTSWKLREEQIPIVEYLSHDGHPTSKFLGAQTGMGKSLMAMFASVHFNKRTVIIVRAMYIAKWVSDFKKTTNIKDDEVITIRGGDQLQTLLNLAETNLLHAKIIIISITTLQRWYKDYEVHREYSLDMGYACIPENFYDFIGAGLRLIDEVHLDIHLQCKIDMYTNVQRSISLSATLLSTDQFIKRMQEMLYPPSERYQGLALDRYIESYAYLYHIKTFRKYQVKEYGSNNYSHNAFEKSIIRSPDFLKSYLELIDYITNVAFIERYKPGQKFIIFASSIKMCTKIVEYLIKQHPTLDIRRFVEDDPEENLFEPDIRVTTVLSGGTAHDIPNLIGTLLTNSLNSIQSNIQVLGRLRKIPNQSVRFYYMACMDIPQQMKYHEAKTQMLNERAASFKVILANSSV